MAMTNLKEAILLLMIINMGLSLYCEPYNCYQLLEVSNTATTEEIKKAFRLMARRHHPDKNRQQDTTQLFQKINIAYQILQNEHTRKAYDYFVRDPSGSRAYHTYQYYRASYSPQVNPFFVLISLFLLLSWLQWVMRKQMYSTAVQNIVNSLQFKKRVNQQCQLDGRKGDKAYKQQVAQRLQQQISIQGGYSKPKVQDLLFVRIIMLPYTLVMWIKSVCRWIWKYYIKRQQYDEADQSQLTRKVLKVPIARWESLPQVNKKQLILRKLWISQNMTKYREQMQQQQLQQIRISNPAKYKKIMSFLKKQQ